MVNFDVVKETEYALECLKSSYDDPDFELENPNGSDEITIEAFEKSAEALITPFFKTLQEN